MFFEVEVRPKPIKRKKNGVLDFAIQSLLSSFRHMIGYAWIEFHNFLFFIE